MTEVWLVWEVSSRGGEPSNGIGEWQEEMGMPAVEGLQSLFLISEWKHYLLPLVGCEDCSKNNNMVDNNSWHPESLLCDGYNAEGFPSIIPCMISNSLWNRNHHQPHFSDRTN